MKIVPLVPCLCILLYFGNIPAAATASVRVDGTPIGRVNAGVSAGKAPGNTLDHPHRQLRQILAQPPFQQWRLREQRRITRVKNPLWDSISRQWDRLMKWLGHYFHPHKQTALHGHRSAAGLSFANVLEILATVVGIALAAGIVLVLFRWQALGKTAAATADGLLSREKIKQAMEQGDALAMASDSWMRAARQFHGDGDFRAMYRAMYLSLLAGLHETGKIRFRRNYTNWHYVRDFHGDKPRRALFESLTDLFDHVWYGRKLYPNINPDVLREQISTLIVPHEQQDRAGPTGVPPKVGGDKRA